MIERLGSKAMVCFLVLFFFATFRGGRLLQNEERKKFLVAAADVIVQPRRSPKREVAPYRKGKRIGISISSESEAMC
jgi:hypothetical protein